MPATPSTSVTAASPSRPSPTSIPLWSEVKEVEASLRPEVDALIAARTTPSRFLFAASVLVVLAAVVVWSVLLERQALILSRSLRPPLLQGPAIPGVVRFFSPGRIVESWQNIGAAFGSATAIWLLTYAIKSWRPVALRWSWIPLTIGAATWLGAQWYLLFVVT
ncbi:MAG: hypothetical protein Q8K82_00695 [Gemmatimonadaceae bacterium]|nr:hypothetical protein [Gemmatimonadaceae bacterium]